jgi:hypothetical protein
MLKEQRPELNEDDEYEHNLHSCSGNSLSLFARVNDSPQQDNGTERACLQTRFVQAPIAGTVIKRVATHTGAVSAQNKKILGTGIEPVTYCVLSSRHNQLDHPSLIVLIAVEISRFRI